MKKENRRIMMTKMLLKDSLKELLETKDIYHISVRALCEQANVNRTTFYKYYGSQFELLTDIEVDVINFINSTIKNDHTNIEKILISICTYLEDNIDFMRLLINNNIDPNFPQKIFSSAIIKENILNSMPTKYKDLDKDYLYDFITYGSFSILAKWINKNNREKPSEIAKTIKLIADLKN